MSTAAKASAWCGAMSVCAALAAWPLASSAQTVSEATAESLLRSAAGTAAPQPLAAWKPRRSLDLTSLRVVELPEDGPRLGPPSRKHHALMWRSDALSQSLNNAGIAQAECHHRVRLPSRLRAAPDGSGPALQVQLQLAIGCSF